MVSTHSRSKAAAHAQCPAFLPNYCFNSQPLEGGCQKKRPQIGRKNRFQLTAARRRLPPLPSAAMARQPVSTHNRSKAAASCFPPKTGIIQRFQLTAARRRLPPYQDARRQHISVSTHSRSKAAARAFAPDTATPCRFNSQPLEGGCARNSQPTSATSSFQLTAARRRLRSALT